MKVNNGRRRESKKKISKNTLTIAYKIYSSKRVQLNTDKRDSKKLNKKTGV